MDEADKYKQRLEAIAEKRRVQEEQDRAKRELEDEKLRLQQLKRKSLRDQWLMEGAPLSPTSPDAQSPRSPLWGSQAQEMEKRIDKLQSESQRLAEEEEKLKEQMEDGQTNTPEVQAEQHKQLHKLSHSKFNSSSVPLTQQEVVKVGEAGAEVVHDDVVQNGENNATGVETTEDEVKPNKSPRVDETAAVLTNGGGVLEEDTNPDALEQSNQSFTNGPIVASEGVNSMKLEPRSSLGVSEAAPGQVSNVDIDEEEEGTLMMRAERVMITEEGDDVPEDHMSQEDQQKATQSEETPLPNPEAGQEGGEAAGEAVKTEAGPQTFTQPEKSEEIEPTAEAQPATTDELVEGGVKTNEHRDGETKAEGQVQPPANAQEGTAVSSVPVYSESALTPELEAEGAAALSPEGAETALKAQDPVTLSGQFQEVPLADPQENQRTEAGPGEQEPLLSQAKAPNTRTEPASANSPPSTETHSPTRASQGEETEAPKRKTCQCCSVM